MYSSDYMTDASRAREFLKHIMQPVDGRRPNIIDIESVKHDFNAFSFKVWNDFDADLPRAAAMRWRLSDRMYPLTSTIHVLSYQGLLSGWLLRLLLTPIYRCDAVVSTTEACRRALENLLAQIAERFNAQFGTKLKFCGQHAIIPYPVNTELFRPGRRKEARAKLELPQDAFIIGWVGRFSPLDKADLVPLIRVFSQLLAANPNRKLLLVLAGTGRSIFRDALNRCARDLQVAEHIRVISPLGLDRRADVHAALDVFTSPVDNLQETAGITPLEALASGVPQVVADWDGYRDTVVNGRTGFLIPTFWAECDHDIALHAGLFDDHSFVDHFALAQSVALDLRSYRHAFQILLDNDELREEMGACSREKALVNHSPVSVISRYEDLWSTLLPIASGIPFLKTRNTQYDQASYFQAFRQYPSHIVRDDAALVVTSAGEEALASALAVPTWLPLAPGLSTTALITILRSFHSRSCFGDAARLAARKFGISESIALRHVLWLIKQGFAELSDD